MRHQKRVKKLRRPQDQRKAMLRSMATSLFMHGQIRTTVTRAKVLKSYAEKLITFAKGGGPHKTRIDIVELVRNILDTKLGPKNIIYAFDFEQIPGHYFADLNQLKTAISNIIQNSLDSMTQTGRIGVSIRYLEEAHKTPRISISISDSGIGISKEHLDMIFNPYFTTKPMGTQKSTGLGLSIAWSIIARHGGNIHVESEKNQGTTVHIFLPVFNSDTAETTGPEQTDENNAGPIHTSGISKRILVVDDDELTLDVVSRLLKCLKYEVATASRGSQALEICRAAMSHGKKMDLALLDYDMTGGMNGFQTLEKLKEADSGIIGILMTGHSDHNEVKKYRQQGFSGLLEKPFSIKQLEDTLKAHFHS